MFNVVILAVGKIKEKHWRTAVEEYSVRLKPFARVVVEEIAAEPFRREADKEKAKQKEGERLLVALSKYSDSEIIILDERGREFTSVEFADFFSREARRVIFVIGGALGFGDNFSKRTFTKISLSKMTLPHELARVVLLEQIYRASTIVSGKSYHY
ncbi:23S rRNA (pseudouridine(1915)-N(3))-methyltransferase RlmH [Patescibacteria group bacterium]|nr:23S rRNA (pseudouridine(1915)-N(3))-methyltransferase RlmH [Patescibacteria group bacterium]